MKALKRDLQSVIKTLKLLTEKAEKMERALEGLSTVPAVKKQPVQAAKPPVRKKAPATASESVLTIINRQKKGIDTAGLKKKTDFDTKTIRNVIFRLKKQGKIKTDDRGVYMPA